jgi:predicted RNase H-like nuclease (RuvC/YqgF family)
MQSLYRTGTLQNLIEVTQDYKIDLLAVQEVRWLGKYNTGMMMMKIFLEHALLLVNISDQD